MEDLPASAIYRMIDEAAGAGAKMVVLLGGEPMMHPAIKQIVDYGASRLKLRILTNGTLIDRNWAKTFREKNVQVQISLDGSTPEIHNSIRGKGVFEKAIKSANYIINEESGDRLNFCTTIMKQNVNDLFNIISFAENLKIPRLQFLPLLKMGRAVDRWNDIHGMDIEDYENFFQKIWDFQCNPSCKVEFTYGLSGFFLDFADDPAGKSLWCPLGNNLVIDSNGDAYPCSLLMYNDFLLGNIYENTLTEILESDQMKNIIRILVQRRYEIEKCAECTWRSFCQAGCMGHAYDHAKNVWRTDDFCQYRKRAFKKAMNRFLQDA
jgi:radical SAM protein with 4Fe4S-binding SPASM domain